MLKIYLDLDSTLNNFVFEWVHFINQKYKANFTVRDVRYFNHLVDMFGIEALIDFFKQKPYDNNIIKPLPGVYEFLNQLKQFNPAELKILSNTHKDTREEKRDWIERWFPDVEYEFTFNNKEEYICSSDDTFKVFVDDYPYHLIKVPDCNLRMAFNYNGLYNYIYEYNLEEHGIIEVKSYREIIRKIKDIIIR